MKAVLLAAGRGARLYPLTNDIPKPLVQVGDRTCLDIALDSLSRVADEVIVVTGFLSEKIESHLRENPPAIPYQICINPVPEKGNLTSLEAARPLIEGGEFIVTNADHLFPVDFYTKHFSATPHITVAGENDRTFMDDEMKVVEREGVLEQISKTLGDYDGVYIGATRIPGSCAAAYWAAFDRVRENCDLASACVENILHELAREAETAPHVSWVKDVRWFEVDTPEDLDIARKGLA